MSKNMEDAKNYAWMSIRLLYPTFLLKKLNKVGNLLLLLFNVVIFALLWIVIKVPWWAKPLVIIITFLAVKGDEYLGRREFKKYVQNKVVYIFMKLRL